MNAPLVSVVIAAYKSNPIYLLQALDSALEQTWTAIEVLVVDDSPTDDLRTLLVSRNNTRLHYLHNAPSLGVARNHWRAFREARGEFIAILNHDDLFKPEFVSTLVNELLQEPHCVLAFCDHYITDDVGKILVGETERASMLYGRANLRPGMHRPFGSLVIAQTIPMAMGAVFRRASLPVELPDHAGPAYDLWLTYLLARNGGGAYYVPQRLSSWRTHQENLTSGGGLAWLIGSAYCWQAMASDSALVAYKAAAQRKAAGGFVACAKRGWRDGRRFASMRFALQSLRMRFSARGLALLLLLPWLPVGLVNRCTLLRARRS